MDDARSDEQKEYDAWMEAHLFGSREHEGKDTYRTRTLLGTRTLLAAPGPTTGHLSVLRVQGEMKNKVKEEIHV